MSSMNTQSQTILCFDPDRDFLVNIKQAGLAYGCHIEIHDSFRVITDGTLLEPVSFVLIHAGMYDEAVKGDIIGELLLGHDDVPIAISYDERQELDPWKSGEKIALFIERSMSYTAIIEQMLQEMKRSLGGELFSAEGF